MNYYYDILLNFQDNLYMFYEWEEEDVYDYIKKIPLFHIQKKDFQDIWSNKIKVEESFLNMIENKTKTKRGDYLKYVAIFSDGSNNIALEFNNEGISTNKSSLLLDDELNINEFVYNVELTKVNYKILSQEEILRETKQDIKIKKILKTEIKTMFNNKDKSKFKYIYLEWFNELNDNYEEMFLRMLDKINNRLTNKEYEIYELIKMTYSV